MKKHRRLRIAVGPTSLPPSEARERPVTPPALWTPEAAAGVRPLTEREAERLVNRARRGGFLEEALERAAELERDPVHGPALARFRDRVELEREMAANLREDLQAAGLSVTPLAEPHYDPETWTPKDIPGLAYWFDASAARDLGDGRVLLVDGSGNGRDTVVRGQIVESDPRFGGRKVVELESGIRIGGLAMKSAPEPGEGKR